MTRDDETVRREFHVWVDGRLSDRFSRGLDGVEQRDDGHETVLTGDYRDESQLRGMLEELHGLGITVRRFEVVPRSDASTTDEHPAHAEAANGSAPPGS